MIDVHVISRDKPVQEWLDKAVSSIPKDICNIHILKMEGKGIAFNRIRGFNIGNNEYVSYVDDDDYVVNDAFQKCLAHLEEHKDLSAVGTMESRLMPSGNIIEPDLLGTESMANINQTMAWMAMHHLSVFRRSAIVPHLESLYDSNNCERRLLRSMHDAGLKTEILPFVGYVWRIHNKSSIQRWRAANGNIR